MIVAITPIPNVWTRVTRGPAFPARLSSVAPAPATAWETRSLTGPASDTSVRTTMMMTPNVAPRVAPIAARP